MACRSLSDHVRPGGTDTPRARRLRGSLRFDAAKCSHRPMEDLLAVTAASVLATGCRAVRKLQGSSLSCLLSRRLLCPPETRKRMSHVDRQLSRSCLSVKSRREQRGSNPVAVARGSGVDSQCSPGGRTGGQEVFQPRSRMFEGRRWAIGTRRGSAGFGSLLQRAPACPARTGSAAPLRECPSDDATSSGPRWVETGIRPEPVGARWIGSESLTLVAHDCALREGTPDESSFDVFVRAADRLAARPPATGRTMRALTS
jgi:hypothetical protein